METETPKCNTCGQPMIEVGGIGKNIQLGEYRQQPDSEYKIWYQTGVREEKLYQCPECKDVKIN